MSKRLIIGGGGSAGHVLPSIRIANYLKHIYPEIFYIGGKDSIEESLCKEYGIQFFSIKTAKFDRSKKLKLPLAIIINLIGVFQSFVLIRKLKPNAVFVSGGYASVPLVVGAKIFGVRSIVVHVCDLTLGLAHKLSLPFATRITCTFLATAEVLRKGIYVGPITDSTQLKNREKTEESHSKQRLLVYGGSLGATTINLKVRSSLNEILVQYNVIHICGVGNLDFSLNNLEGYTQFEFVHNFTHLLSQVDLAICRGGSSSLWELIMAGIPHLAIPLPTSVSRGDQIENCKYLASKGVTTFLEQDQFKKSNLLDELNKLTALASDIRQNMIKIRPLNEAKKVIEQILSGEDTVYN